VLSLLDAQTLHYHTLEIVLGETPNISATFLQDKPDRTPNDGKGELKKDLKLILPQKTTET
jgi:hypothetical protein